MSKRNEVSIKGSGSIQSLQDLGYRLASHVDGEKAFLIYAKENIQGFPDKKAIPDEIKAQVVAGMVTRYAETHPAKHYVQEGEDTFVESDKSVKGGFSCSVGYCMSLSTHDFGSLMPNKKSLVKTVRDAAKNYCDVRWNRLLKSAKELGDAVEGNTKSPNKLFIDAVNEFLANLPKKNAAARTRGDATAQDDAKLRVKIERIKAIFGE